jgi:hypothetical protein
MAAATPPDPARPSTVRVAAGGVAAVITVLGAAAVAVGQVSESATEPPIRPPDRAFVEALPRDRAEIWAVGDGADGSAGAAGVTARIERARPDGFLYLGDVYESGTAEEYARNYAPTWGRLAAITAPTLGNHEAARAVEGYEPYWRGVHGERPPSFYSFRAAGWQLLSLNSEIDHGRGSAQLRWLRERTGRGGDCRIAFWHRPRWSAGDHGNAPDMRPVWRALARRARVAIGGHDHNMQRFAPRGGIVQLVSGAGGRAVTPVDREHPGLRFADDVEDGALRMRLRRGVARLQFVAAGGGVLDSSTVRCRR